MRHVPAYSDLFIKRGAHGFIERRTRRAANARVVEWDSRPIVASHEVGKKCRTEDPGVVNGYVGTMVLLLRWIGRQTPWLRLYPVVKRNPAVELLIFRNCMVDPY